MGQSVLALMRHVAERTRAQDASITHVDLAVSDAVQGPQNPIVLNVV